MKKPFERTLRYMMSWAANSRLATALKGMVLRYTSETLTGTPSSSKGHRAARQPRQIDAADLVLGVRCVFPQWSGL